MITKNKIIQAADNAGWSCTIEKRKNDKWYHGGYYIAFNTDTHYGQDVWYEYDVKTLEEVIEAVQNSYDGYDIDEEVYLWIDNTGHPKNGAPSSISALLADMQEKENLLEKLNEELQKLE